MQVYGDDASLIMPTTFELPSQLREWIEFLKLHKQSKATDETMDALACGPETKWVLKTTENLGMHVS